MTSQRGYFAHVAEMKKRKTLRADWKCAHHPLCDSLVEHDVLAKFEADAKAKRIAETIAATPAVQRLLRFTVERVDDAVVRKMTTASELYQVSECGPPWGLVVRTHFVAVRENDTHICVSCDEPCSAVAAVLSQKLNASLADAPT